MKIINEKSELYARIVKAEQLLEELGIEVCCFGNMYLKDTRTQKEYKIGRDSDQFPRGVDEPFIVIE